MEEYKSVQKYLSKNKKTKPSFHFPFSYLNKVLLAGIILLVVLCTTKVNQGFKNWIYQHVYQDNISFAQVNAVYEKYFGKLFPSPTINDPVRPVFQEKLVYSKMESYKDGVKLTVGEDYLVPILESGIVVFMGNKDNYGKTIIIQQVNGVDLWYVGVDNTNIKLYDYVEKGSLLGEAISNEIDLYYQKSGEFLDYKEYLG